jgi:O-acetyl-ADP-ribose deacetylase (regulator of RNase III)
MMSKVQKISINTIKDELCPFHTIDERDKKICLFKHLVTLNTIAAIIEGDNKITQSEWNKDCCGEWSNCCIIPLIYTFDEEDNIEDNTEEDTEEVDDTPVVEISEKQFIDPKIDDYDPYDNSEDDEEEVDVAPIEINEAEEVEVEERDILAEKGVKLLIRRVSNPYLVKGDVLVYPNNQGLIIDDDELNRRTGLRLAGECKNLLKTRPIKMGQVYITSNGNNGQSVPGGVAAKKIYHAIVAGVSRLVGPEINVTSLRALLLADSMGAKTVVMMPFDCGEFDVDEGAKQQLSGIRKFIETDIQNIKNIYIVMKENDSISEEAFLKYYDKIF